MDSIEKVSLELLKNAENLLNNPDWQANGFVKNLHSELMTSFTEYQSKLAEFGLISGKQVDAEPQKKNKVCFVDPIIQDNETIIYVLLYNQSIIQLDNWTLVLQSLSHLSSSRPIYDDENNIKNVLSGKLRQTNYAYVAVKINTNDIMKEKLLGRRYVDAVGNKLLFLKHDAIKYDNIIKFVYDGKIYTIEKGKLKYFCDVN